MKIINIKDVECIAKKLKSKVKKTSIGILFHVKDNEYRRLNNDFYYYNDDIKNALNKIDKHIDAIETYFGELDSLRNKATSEFFKTLARYLSK